MTPLGKLLEGRNPSHPHVRMRNASHGSRQKCSEGQKWRRSPINLVPQPRKKKLSTGDPHGNTSGATQNPASYLDAFCSCRVAGAEDDLSLSVTWLSNAGETVAVATTRLRLWDTSVLFRSSRNALLAGLLES